MQNVAEPWLVLRLSNSTYWFYGLLIHDGVQIVEGRRLQLVCAATPPQERERRTAWERLREDDVVPGDDDA
jgi:hypothetical protein